MVADPWSRDSIIGRMAICQDCNREMLIAASCTVSALRLQGGELSLTAYGRDGTAMPGGGRCGDCGVMPGGNHHLGRDMQRCPRCRGQLISCGCPFDEFGGVELEDELAEFDDEEANDDVADSEDGRRMCPSCGSDAVIPIFYGRATPGMKRLASQRVLELADQAFAPGRPSSRCRDCDHAWSVGTSRP